MGCGSSRAAESRVVSLCRERRELIRAAADRRYALASAHAAYFRALAAVGDSLERFVREELAVAPVLTLPSDGKGKSKSVSSASDDGGGSRGSGGGSSSVTPLSHSLSDDGSHLHVSSGSERKGGGGDGGGGGGGVGVESSSSPPRSASAASSPNYSFMRSSTAFPTMVYEDPITQQWQHPSNSGYGYGYEYGYGYGYPPYGVPIGSPLPGRENSYYYDQPMSPPVSAAAAPSTPPPPPPPEGSAWEFFDPFNTYEKLLPEYGGGRYGVTSYASSPDSSEVREKEGIPDLEDETEVEAMKKVGKEKKVVTEDSGGKESSIGSYKTESTQEMGEKDEKNGKIGSEEKESKSSSVSSRIRSNGEDDGSSGKKKGVKFEEEASFVMEESRPSSAKALSTPSSGKSSSTPSNGKLMSDPSSGNAHGPRDVAEVVKEIKGHFNSAANYGEEVSGMLEVGKLPYRSRSRMFRVIPSRIWRPMALTMLTSSRPSFKHSRRSAANTIRSRASNGISEKHMGTKSGDLSSTLEKLYVWEKKLCKEVKDEEKLQSIYDKKYKRLKALDRGGAEFNKIDSARASIRKLRTKISIIIKSVDAISNRMHKIRDEELQPQLTELIQGLVKMWKSLLDCHRKQLQAIVDSKSQSLTAKTGRQSQTIAKATKELEVDLLHWLHCFKEWISTQKAYNEALNGWLMKWLPEELEQTPDGVAPFSPGRIGAPAVYIISNDWFHAIKSISEDKATETMHDFSVIAHKLWESQNREQDLRLKAEYLSRDYDRRRKSLQQDSGMNERMDIVSVTENGEEHHDDRLTELDSMKKRLEEVKAKHDETVKQVQDAASSILQTGLIPIFEALETFSSETLRAYEGVRLPNERGS
uniref:Nitrate regulatory gene2 protein n=1 Tax=Elaeis guineensis var. tenera TaxID=51953 RepID=A0A6I9RR30_ELAGV|nr:nitrate regulatory gene2 protein [Elaeis guineensis]